MVRKILLMALAIAMFIALVMAFGPGQADAAPPMACAPNERVTKDLDRRYDEQPIAMGMHANGMMMQLFASEQNRTWTIVLTQPNGLSCLIGSGHSFEQLQWQALEWQS